VQDSGEVICVVKDGLCFVEARLNDIMKCQAEWDPLMQTGRNCRNLEFRSEPFPVQVIIDQLEHDHDHRRILLDSKGKRLLSSAKGPKALLATQALGTAKSVDKSDAYAALHADLRSLRYLFPKPDRIARPSFLRQLASVANTAPKDLVDTTDNILQEGAAGSTNERNYEMMCPAKVTIDLETIDNFDPMHCNLCYENSCNEIENQEYELKHLNAHQEENIAFGFDAGVDCVADTIGACIFCEEGDPRDPHQCVFTNPDETVKHWQVSSTSYTHDAEVYTCMYVIPISTL
jgi:hypothetical protein